MPSLAVGTAGYVLARPFLELLHEVVIVVAAALLGASAPFLARAAESGLAPFDPVYTGAMFRMLSDIETAGLAVPQPFGQLPHQIWPRLFASPELLAGGAGFSAVIEPGASVLARGVASLSGDVFLLALGLALMKAG